MMVIIIIIIIIINYHVKTCSFPISNFSNAGFTANFIIGGGPHTKI